MRRGSQGAALEILIDQDNPQITVAVVPREKFSCSLMTLDALLSEAEAPFRLIYVDGNSPPSVARGIRQRLEAHPHARILRREHFLGPLQSRNLAIEAAGETTKYLVILDNDVLVRPGWLETLHRCAEQEDAGGVVPLVLIGGPSSDIIHHAGGETGVRHQDGRTELYHHQNLEHHRLSDVEQQLRRQPTRLLEDHCIFARTSLWRSLGRLDDQVPLMTSVPEISFLFQKSGAKLMVEPAARVTYLFGDDVPLDPADLAFWYLAWSEKWSRHDMRRMANEYGLSKSRDEDRHVIWWMGDHRRSAISPVLGEGRRFFERNKLPTIGKVVVKATEQLEDIAALVLAELVRRTPAGSATGCPPLLAPYPRRHRHP